MALTNCSINSTSEVVPQDQGNIISQTLYIVPDNGYLISAVDFSVADRSYTNNSSSLEFVNGINGVILDIAINSITLSNTTNVGATDNKVKVIVDFENGYTMPGADTVLTIDIDGEAVSDGLIDLRAVLLVSDTQPEFNISTSAATNITYEQTDGTGLASSTYDRVYLSTTENVEPGAQIKLATITVTTGHGGYENYHLSPEPYLGQVDGEGVYMETPFAIDKFDITNLQTTYNGDGLLQSYIFDLMFTDDIDLSNNPWSANYSTLGEFFPNVTVNLNVRAVEVYIPVENSGVVDTITTNVTQTVSCDPLEVPSCL